jgi:hypothetical protein
MFNTFMGERISEEGSDSHSDMKKKLKSTKVIQNELMKRGRAGKIEIPDLLDLL